MFKAVLKVPDQWLRRTEDADPWPMWFIWVSSFSVGSSSKVFILEKVFLIWCSALSPWRAVAFILDSHTMVVHEYFNQSGLDGLNLETISCSKGQCIYFIWQHIQIELSLDLVDCYKIYVVSLQLETFIYQNIRVAPNKTISVWMYVLRLME